MAKARLVFVAVPVMALAVPALAQDEGATGGDRGTGAASAPAEGRAAASTSARFVSGRIDRASDGALVIETQDGARETLVLHDRTAIVVDGEVARADRLKPGQRVRASYDARGGQKLAVSVRAGEGVQGGAAGASGTGSGASGGADAESRVPDQAGDTGKSGNPNTYQQPGAQPPYDAGTGAGRDAAGAGAPEQAGDTGSSAGSSNTYQEPGAQPPHDAGTGARDAAGAGAPEQAGDTGASAGSSNTYQEPGSVPPSGSTGSEGSSDRSPRQ